MAAPKGGKKVIRRRRERKHIEKGAAHIQSLRYSLWRDNHLRRDCQKNGGQT